MADHLTTDERSRNMARVKGRDTKPELIVRRLLHRIGYRFRLHRKDLPGKPDIVLPRHKKAIFVHGCFWHGHPGCRRATHPADNAEFWAAKLDRNVARDAETLRCMGESGWNVLVIWECQTRDTVALEGRIKHFMTDEELPANL